MVSRTALRPIVLTQEKRADTCWHGVWKELPGSWGRVASSFTAHRGRALRSYGPGHTFSSEIKWQPCGEWTCAWRKLYGKSVSDRALRKYSTGRVKTVIISWKLVPMIHHHFSLFLLNIFVFFSFFSFLFSDTLEYYGANEQSGWHRWNLSRRQHRKRILCDPAEGEKQES